MYNLTNYTAANGFLDVSIASNSLVSGYLFVFVIALIFVITFVALKNNATDKAFLTASLVTFVLTAALWGAGIVGETALVVTFVLLLIGFAINIIAE